VYNGEIYNFLEVKAELIALGHRFSTKSDTEIIVHGWEQWGESCVDRFRGMFAFVIWDEPKQTVFCARDRLGVKPLFYSWLPNNQFIFGSELKALTSHPSLSKLVDPFAVEEYLTFGYIPDPRTIYRSASKLPAAHCLTFKVGDKSAQARRYWRPSYEKIAISQEDALVELDQRLMEAVKYRLVSDVPLGAFLSGGVDSSLVVAAMSRLNPERRVLTSSIGFDVPEYDETRYALAVAERYNTNHQTQIVSIDDVALVPELFKLYDEPFSDSSALATYRVSEEARKRVTVALSGDGGDELFGGYRRYRMHVGEEAVRRATPSPIRKLLFGGLASVYPEGQWLPRSLRAKNTFRALARSPLESYFRAMSVIPDTDRADLLSPALKKELHGYSALEVFKKHADEFEGDDPLDFIQHIDLNTWLSGDINTKVDRASMAHSLEVREPLLDHKLLEWAASLPSKLKISPSNGKILLKQRAEKLLPRETVHRPKQGFSLPIDQWFRGPLKTLLSSHLDSNEALAQLINIDQVKKLLDDHNRASVNHDRKLWAILSLAEFTKREMGDVAHA
jgi:asparagine synthase (glutamine-hydrolysing)